MHKKIRYFTLKETGEKRDKRTVKPYKSLTVKLLCVQAEAR